jgi:hypothetical protein
MYCVREYQSWEAKPSRGEAPLGQVMLPPVRILILFSAEGAVREGAGVSSRIACAARQLPAATDPNVDSLPRWVYRI